MGWPLYTAAVSLTANLVAAAAPATEVPPADPMPAVEVIDMELERHRRMTVPVTIGGEGPFRFLIDTGSQATVVSRALADRLELFDRRPATLIAMASIREVETTAIPEFALGSRSFLIQTAPVIDGAHIGGADGILGLDSLQNQRVLFDFARRELSVADAESGASDRGFEIVVKARSKLGQLIITRARLDGVRVAVIVDTGAQGSIGNLALFDQLRGRATGQSQLTDVNGVVLGGSLKSARNLVLGRVRLSNMSIMFTDSPTFESLGLADEPALILGMQELKLFDRVAIDFPRRRVLFDLPRGTGFGALARFSGRD